MNIYDDMATTWDDGRRVERARIVAQEIRKHMPNPCARGLEFGCGTGLISFFLQDAIDEIVLIDLSQGMIDVLRKKIRESGIVHMHARQMDVLNESFGMEQFDFLYTSMALHHVREIDAVLRRLHACLALGATVCVVDMGKDDGSFHKNELDFAGHHGFEMEEIRTAFERTGFEVQRVDTFYRAEKVIDGHNVPYSLFCLCATKRDLPREAVIAFARTVDAIRAEQALAGAGLAPRVMPLPSAIRAGCGICLRVDIDHRGDALDVLAQSGLTHAGLYMRYVADGGSRYVVCADELPPV